MRVFTALTMLGAGLALAAPAAADPWSAPQQIATGTPGGGSIQQLVESNGGDALALLFSQPDFTSVERPSTAAPWGVQAPFPTFAGASSSSVSMLPSGALVAGWLNIGSCEVNIAERSPAGLWGPTTTFSQACAKPEHIAQPPVIALGRDGALLVAWRDQAPDQAQTIFVERTNDGVWHEPFVVDGATPLSAAIDGKGNGVVELLLGASPLVIALQYVDAGRPRSLQPLPTGTLNGLLSSSPQGKVVLAVNRLVDRQLGFVDVYTGTPKRLKLAATFGGSGTEAFVTMHAAAIDDHGDAIVAWRQRGTIRNSLAVMVSRRVGSRGAFGAPVTIDRPHTGQETEANAYLDRRGAATVSWFDSVFKTDIGQLQVASAPVGGSFASPTPLATTTATNGMEALLAGDAAGDVTAVWSAHHDGDQSSSVFDTFASQRPPVSG